MTYFVKCIKRNERENYFTVGKVYEVNDKGICCDDGFLFESYKSDIYGNKNTIESLNNWFEPCGYKFKLVKEKPPKIIVTTDGTKVTTATLYEDGEKIKTATAKLAPEDTFDFAFGAKLAVERLTAKNEPPKSKYYNGKVVCISTAFNDGDFTVGKVYEIVDGKFTDNDGNIRPATNQWVHSLSDLTDEHNDYFSEWHYKFIPFVED